MDKGFLEWWERRKHEMFYDDNMGVREIAAAAYKAGRESAQQSAQATAEWRCPNCEAMNYGDCWKCGNHQPAAGTSSLPDPEIPS